MSIPFEGFHDTDKRFEHSSRRVYYSSRLVFDHWSTTCVTSPSLRGREARRPIFPNRVTRDRSGTGSGSTMDLATMKKGIEKSGKGGGGKRGQEVSLSFPLQRSPFPIPGLFARFFRFLALRGTMRGDEKADQPRFLFSVERLGSLLRENRHRFLEQHHRRNVPVSRSIHRSKNGRPISREFRGGERLNLKLNLRRDRVTFILFDHFGNTIDVRKEK